MFGNNKGMRDPAYVGAFAAYGRATREFLRAQAAFSREHFRVFGELPKS